MKGETGQVDHFIPWSRYPVDLGHNFVLAHGACNGRKSDRLASAEHLAEWAKFHEQHSEGLAREFCQRTVKRDHFGSKCGPFWMISIPHLKALNALGGVLVNGHTLRRHGEHP